MAIKVRSDLSKSGVSAFGEGQAINVMEYGAVIDGVTNCSVQLQAAIDAGYAQGRPVVFPQGDYGIQTLVIYTRSHLVFAADAVLIKLNTTGFCILTQPSPTLLYGKCDSPIIEYLQLDMNYKGWAGLMAQAVWRGIFICCEISRVPPAGTFSYVDGSLVSPGGAVDTAKVYDKAGVILKGTENKAGAYYNQFWLLTVANPAPPAPGGIPVPGGVTTDSTLPRGGRGIVLTNTAGGFSQLPNMSRFLMPRVAFMDVGIDAPGANDALYHKPEPIYCAIGIKLGIGDGVRASLRNRCEDVYAEWCIKGVHFTSDCRGNFASFASVNGIPEGQVYEGLTGAILHDEGTFNSWTRPKSGDWARFYEYEVRGVSRIEFGSSSFTDVLKFHHRSVLGATPRDVMELSDTTLTMRAYGASNYALKLDHSHATTPFGMDIFFSGGSFSSDTSRRYILARDTGATRFQVLANGNAQNVGGVFGAISDEALKQDIRPASSQWEDVKAIGRIASKWRNKADVLAHGDDAPEFLGWVAQAIGEISPGLVEDVAELEDAEVVVVDADGQAKFHPLMRTDGSVVVDESGAPVPDTYNPRMTMEARPTGRVVKTVKQSILHNKAVIALAEAMERIEALEKQLQKKPRKSGS